MSGKKGRNSGMLEKINDRIEIPAGILCGGIHIEMNSNREILLDGKCNILEYSDNCIKLNSGNGIIVICGMGLDIISMHPNGIEICGKIVSVSFEE